MVEEIRWTLREAATQCGVHVDTVKRRLDELKEHGAKQNDLGAWTVTPSALRAVGLHPGRPTPPEAKPAPAPAPAAPEVAAPPQPDAALRLRITELEHAVKVEQVKREAAEAIAAERLEGLRRYDIAMRMLESAQPSRPTVEQIVQAELEQAQPRRAWWGGRKRVS